MKNISLFLAFLLAALTASPLSPPSPDTTILLDGTASLYADTYSWRQISGPAISLTDSDSAICKVAIAKEGKYEFELTCTNKYGAGKDSVIITAIRGVLSLDIDQEHKNPRPGTPEKLKIDIAQGSNDIQLRIESPRHQRIDCTIYDALGRAIAKTSMMVSTGINHVRLPKPNISGIYYLRFTTYYEGKTLKLII